MERREYRFCLLIFFVSCLLCVAGVSDKITAEIPEDIPDTTQIEDKISTDLLQLLDPAYCSPGASPGTAFEEMEVFGQTRITPAGEREAHVSVMISNTTALPAIRPLLSGYSEDLATGMIHGWTPLFNLRILAGMDAVSSVESILPPVTSGSIIPLEEKESSPPEPSGSETWKQKISTDLLQLVDETTLSPGQDREDIRTLLTTTGEMKTENGTEYVLVSARTTRNTSTALNSFFQFSVTDTAYQRMAGWIPVENLTKIAMEPALVSLMIQLPPHVSAISTEGELLMNTAPFRTINGMNGQGIRIGVISDGVASLEKMKAAGEVPEDLTVLSNTIGGNEGTAMLQIIHDIAPEASLYFHDRGASQIEYIHAIDALIRSGCRIICDDITYVEPFFEDGYVAENIRDRILSYGIVYITSAGNFAGEHYQGAFSGIQKDGYLWHNFRGSGNETDLVFTAPAGCAGHVILQWDDPQGKSANNYDLFLYDSSGHEIGRSVNMQDGDDDPMEWVRFMNMGSESAGYRVGVVSVAAENRTMEVYVLPIGGKSVTVEPNIPEDSVFGQQAVPECISVAAVAAGSDPISAEPFSSRGPVTIRFPAEEQRQKPDIAAPDRVTIALDGNRTAIFSGTSASAPHIGGLAALIWGAEPNLTPSELKTLLLSSGTGTNSTWDNALGYGIPDAMSINISGILTSGSIAASVSDSLIPDYTPREQDSPETLILYPGWNMMAVPSPLKSGHDTGSIFSPVDTDGHTIWRYHAEERRWASLQPGDLLFQMDVIWVYAREKSEITLTYEDGFQNCTSRSLYPGWNPLGIPGKNPVTARSLMSPLGTAWTYILVFDPLTQSYRPSIINGGNGIFSPERIIYPTEGFWVYMNNPAVLME